MKQIEHLRAKELTVHGIHQRSQGKENGNWGVSGSRGGALSDPLCLLTPGAVFPRAVACSFQISTVRRVSTWKQLLTCKLYIWQRCSLDCQEAYPETGCYKRERRPGEGRRTQNFWEQWVSIHRQTDELVASRKAGLPLSILPKEFKKEKFFIFSLKTLENLTVASGWQAVTMLCLPMAFI